MNIGKVAKSSGVSAKMIRHYEESGLIRPAVRTDSNYRVYTAKDVEVLRFVRRGAILGFQPTKSRLCWRFGATVSGRAARSNIWSCSTSTT